jgi:hypothetical protein
VEQYYHPSRSYSCYEQPLFHRPQILEFSLANIQTISNNTTLPQTVRNYPVIAGFGDEVFIVGAVGSSEIWSLTEKLFATDDESEFITSVEEEARLHISSCEHLPTCHTQEIAGHFKGLGMDEEKIFISETDDEATCE